MLSLIEVKKLSVGEGGEIIEVKVVRLRRNVVFQWDGVEVGEVVGDIGCLTTDVSRHDRGCIWPVLDRCCN